MRDKKWGAIFVVQTFWDNDSDCGIHSCANALPRLYNKQLTISSRTQQVLRKEHLATEFVAWFLRLSVCDKFTIYM